ncbi:Gfo/Idh/MocA family oxidoreductase [Candidatus Marinimicrobia bacterium MT.SAG.2]|nr:Gfo/Idh/MocA family oxidoreductase [Candidatus Marinimicrobia bacterium MT.SAG.2]
MKKINVAQIGVGYWGPNLLRNLWLSNSCDVKRVVEISRERQMFVEKNYPGIEITDDINHVLNDPTIDAVVVATPVKSHFGITLAVLEAGKHILVEKPLVTSVKEVNEIRKISEIKDLIVMVGHTFLYNSAVRYIKELLEKDSIGEIRYIYCQRLNLGRIRSDVDVIWNLAPHDISIIEYWLEGANPESISCAAMDYVQDGINDVAFLNIKYPGNIIANIHVSWLEPHKTRRITIVGTKKMIVYDDVSDNKVTIFDKGIDKLAVLGEAMDFDKSEKMQYTYPSGDIHVPIFKWTEPLKVQIEHFFSVIAGREKCLTDLDHAESVIKVLEGCRV